MTPQVTDPWAADAENPTAPAVGPVAGRRPDRLVRHKPSAASEALRTAEAAQVRSYLRLSPGG